VVEEEIALYGPALRKEPRSRKVDKCGTVFVRDGYLSDGGERQRNALGQIQREAPVRIDMLIK
jgi:hypothetical protein